MALEKLKKGRVFLLELPQESYANSVSNVLKQLLERFNAICYITTNKSATVLKRDFSENSFDLRRFTIIDAISGDIPTDDKRVLYVSSPSNLFRLSLTITNVLQQNETDVFIFDSLFTLLSYNSRNLVVQFAQAMINKMQNETVAGIFMVPQSKGNELVKDLSMFVDAIDVVK